VLATQNPIELEGTYPLPEAQLDRFTFKIDVEGVDSRTLHAIATTRRNGHAPHLDVVLSAADLQGLFDTVDRVHLPDAVASFIARLVSGTQPTRPEAPEDVRCFGCLGVSPGAATAIAGTARAAALLAGKPNVGFEEVRRVAHPVLRHRLILDYSARLENWTPSRMVDRVLESVPEVPREMPADVAT
jgi:MoxR-like ATPase